MNQKHHIVAIIATVIFIFILKKYKKSIEKSIEDRKQHNGFIYVLYIPLVIYFIFYLYDKKYFELISTAGNTAIQNMSEDLISSAYPDSLSSL